MRIALGTFGALRKGAGEQTSDVVLLQASEAIFSQQPTGFSDRGPVGGTHVAELLSAIHEKDRE